MRGDPVRGAEKILPVTPTSRDDQAPPYSDLAREVRDDDFWHGLHAAYLKCIDDLPPVDYPTLQKVRIVAYCCLYFEVDNNLRSLAELYRSARNVSLLISGILEPNLLGIGTVDAGKYRFVADRIFESGFRFRLETDRFSDSKSLYYRHVELLRLYSANELAFHSLVHYATANDTIQQLKSRLEDLDKPTTSKFDPDAFAVYLTGIGVPSTLVPSLVSSVERSVGTDRGKRPADPGPMPTETELGKDRKLFSQRPKKDPNTDIIDHLREHWMAWIEAGGVLTQKELHARDKSAAKALSSWRNIEGNDLRKALGGHDIPRQKDITAARVAATAMLPPGERPAKDVWAEEARRRREKIGKGRS